MILDIEKIFSTKELDLVEEGAGLLRHLLILKETACAKITMRHLGVSGKPEVEPLTGEQIRILREQAHMSRAVFAHYLNVNVGYVSQLERGAKRSTGAALFLLGADPPQRDRLHPVATSRRR